MMLISYNPNNGKATNSWEITSGDGVIIAATNKMTIKACLRYSRMKEGVKIPTCDNTKAIMGNWKVSPQASVNMDNKEM